MPTLSTNRRALYDYTILEKFEAGISLLGHEVKSVKEGNVSLKGSYVAMTNQGGVLMNAHIGRYSKAGALPGYDPTRTRALLFTKRELKYLQGKTHEQGLTLVPLSVYTKRALVKVEVALAKGKKKYDKREAIKKREWQRRKRNIASSLVRGCWTLRRRTLTVERVEAVTFFVNPCHNLISAKSLVSRVRTALSNVFAPNYALAVA